MIIVNKMTVEIDDSAVDMDESLYGIQDKPKVFNTMREAKKYISDEVREIKKGYEVEKIERRENDGMWIVNVSYSEPIGFVEFQASKI